jgi:hypothetical protein
MFIEYFLSQSPLNYHRGVVIKNVKSLRSRILGFLEKLYAKICFYLRIPAITTMRKLTVKLGIIRILAFYSDNSLNGRRAI